MDDLTREIERLAERDLKSLKLAPPGELLPSYRGYLKKGGRLLRAAYFDGVGGKAVCAARALLLDRLLEHVWAAWKRTACVADGKGLSLALLAAGGYGRRELNRRSDVDILILHSASGFAKSALDSVLEPLFHDAFLYNLLPRVAHQVRTVEETVSCAKNDMKTKTALLEARLIAGKKRLFDQLRRSLLKKCFLGQEHLYLHQRLEDQRERRTQYGDTYAMQEPHVKNGCGGLRDYQNFFWMLFGKNAAEAAQKLRESGRQEGKGRKASPPRAATLLELAGAVPARLRDQKLLDVDWNAMEEAYDFLLRVREGLHYVTGKGVDILRRDLQPQVARALGWKERSQRERVERFMSAYYTHTRRIFLITRDLERWLALAPRRNGWTRRFFFRKQEGVEVDGFRIAEGELRLADPKALEKDPARIIRAFRYLQIYDAVLSPELAQQIRNRVPRLREAFMRDQQVREAFLEILRHIGSVGSAIRAMHETGALGACLSFFEKLTGKVQLEFYHMHTADEHTIRCLELLDALAKNEEGKMARYGRLAREIDRPEILTLALLLHDSGRSTSKRNHVAASVQIAGKVLAELNVDERVRQDVLFLVRRHLRMIDICLKLDLSDPAVASRFAKETGNLSRLDFLTVLTVVDTVATKENLWNDFRDSSLWTLYVKTRALFEGDEGMSGGVERLRRDLYAQATKQLPPEISRAELIDHLEKVPKRYFFSRGSAEIINDLRLAHRFMEKQIDERVGEKAALKPEVEWRTDPNKGCAVITVCGWEREGTFSKIAGALSASDLHIHNAEIFSRGYLVLDAFDVTDIYTQRPPRRRQIERCVRLLKMALSQPRRQEEIRGEKKLDLWAAVQRRAAAFYALRGKVFHAPPPPLVEFDNETSKNYTIIEVTARDRFGLLYAIASALNKLNADVVLAKVNTEKGMAWDAFYVRELRHASAPRNLEEENKPRKILDPKRVEEIRAGVIEEIRKLDRILDEALVLGA